MYFRVLNVTDRRTDGHMPTVA